MEYGKITSLSYLLIVESSTVLIFFVEEVCFNLFEIAVAIYEPPFTSLLINSQCLLFFFCINIDGMKIYRNPEVPNLLSYMCNLLTSHIWACVVTVF